MKRLGKIALVIVVMLAAAFAVFRTPDTDPAEMKAKYGGPPSQFVELGDGLIVHLRDEGSRDAPVIILLHGTNSDLHTWDAWTRGLVDRYRVIRFDQFGHGLTGRDPKGTYLPESHVATIEQVVVKLGLQRFFLAGHSMSGIHALRYALAHPEQVSGVVLVGAGGAPDWSKGTDNIGFRLAAVPGVNTIVRSITPRSLVERSFKQIFADDALVTAAIVDRHWELVRMPGNREATQIRFSRPFPEFTAADLEPIKAPALVLWGNEDQIATVDGAHFFNRSLPNSTIHTYPGVGHLPMEEAPDRSLADLKAWLTVVGLAAKSG